MRRDEGWCTCISPSSVSDDGRGHATCGDCGRYAREYCDPGACRAGGCHKGACDKKGAGA